MELTFLNNTWEGEITGDCNLHIERDNEGRIYLFQKTISDGKYAIIKDFLFTDDVIDVDITGSIYPKYLKIVSTRNVTKAVLTYAA